MQRLLEKNINTAEEYDKIYEQRDKKGVDRFDLRRWKKLLRHYRGGPLIDLGCLDSQVPALAHKKYPKADITGLDQSEVAITQMRRKYPFITWKKGDVHSTGFDDSSFAYTVAGELLEHISLPQRLIAECVRITKSGGWVAISTPLDEAKEPGAVDGERHVWSFTQEDLIRLLSPYGEVETEILRSIKFPTYKYCWPQLIAWVRIQK